MADVIASSIKLPDDSSNSGKNLRTETRVIGGTTVHEQFVVPIMGLTITGKYFYSSTQLSVSATIQDGLATGFLWLQLPSTATVTALIKGITRDCSTSSTVVAPTAPVLSFTKFTFTGTASGTSVTPVKFQTAGVANQMIVRTAVTGMTNTLIGDVGHFTIPAVLTGVGQVHAQEHILVPDPQAFIRGSDLEIAPGEGLVVYQSVAGTTSDPRRFSLQVKWIEVDLT